MNAHDRQTQPIDLDPEALLALHMARLHDSLTVLDRRLSAARHEIGWSTLLGRLPDGRPYRVERPGTESSVLLFPDDSARLAYEACIAGQPYPLRDLRYASAAQVPSALVSRTLARALRERGIEVERDGGVAIERCSMGGVRREVRVVDVQDILLVVTSALIELRSLNRIAA